MATISPSPLIYQTNSKVFYQTLTSPANRASPFSPVFHLRLPSARRCSSFPTKITPIYQLSVISNRGRKIKSISAYVRRTTWQPLKWMARIMAPRESFVKTSSDPIPLNKRMRLGLLHISATFLSLRDRPYQEECLIMRAKGSIWAQKKFQSILQRRLS